MAHLIVFQGILGCTYTYHWSATIRGSLEKKKSEADSLDARQDGSGKDAGGKWLTVCRYSHGFDGER